MPPVLTRLRETVVNEDFGLHKRAYLFQSAFAAGYILLFYLVLDVLAGWHIAPLGASTFIAFTFPKADSSSPRRLIGGYLLAGLAGTGCSYLAAWLEFMGMSQARIICCALVMFLVMLAMAIVNAEHPPAAAMAITLVLTDRPIPVAVAAVACISMLSLIKKMLLPRLRNL